MAGGRLVRVRVSDGFFPGPGGVLERIGAAVTGLPVSADTAAITASIRAAPGGEAVPAGISPSAVAVAVRRAVLRASDWRDHDWQLVRDGPQDPALHMAIDEVLLREVAAGRRPPTLRIWEWSAPAVVIGSFQSLRNEVDAGQARRTQHRSALGNTYVVTVDLEGNEFLRYRRWGPEVFVIDR